MKSFLRPILNILITIIKLFIGLVKIYQLIFTTRPYNRVLSRVKLLWYTNDNPIHLVRGNDYLLT